MGKNFAILSKLLLDWLPYFNKFREPSMILILFSMSTAVLASWGFQYVQQLLKEQTKIDWEKLFLRIFIGIGVIAITAFLFKGGLYKMMTAIYSSADRSTDRIQRFQNPQQIKYLYQLRFDLFYRDLWISLLFSASTITTIWLAFKKSIYK